MSLSKISCLALRGLRGSLRRTVPAAYISTSDKGKSDADLPTKSGYEGKYAKIREKLTDIDEIIHKEDQLTYGFSDDRVEDRTSMHVFLFSMISVVFCGGLILFLYCPDSKLEDWSTREAYIQIRDREARGEPIVSPDVIPRERVVLPTEEEIGDAKIII